MTSGSPNIPRHAIWQPGMTWESVGDLDPDMRHPLTPGASGPQARLLHMDLMGVDQAFLYPTWFAEGFPLVEDPDVAHVLARAYNDWIADFCSGGAATSLRSSHASAAEHGLRVTGVAPRRGESRASAVPSSGQRSLRSATSPTPTTTRYGLGWRSWE